MGVKEGDVIMLVAAYGYVRVQWGRRLASRDLAPVADSGSCLWFYRCSQAVAVHFLREARGEVETAALKLLTADPEQIDTINGAASPHK